MNTTTTIKLQKYLAHAGVASRRQAEEYIAEGRVTVNGNTATLGERVDPEKDLITFDGHPVGTQETLQYFLVYKPPGIVSTTSDELGRPGVLSLLPKEVTQHIRLFPVGRLDRDSEGLLLLTNDGDLTYRLTHPKHHISKTYQVLIDREPTDKAIDHLESGVKLKEGMTAPLEVIMLEMEGTQQWLQLTIHEGRNRQVRRMLERVGYDTVRLVRIEMGPFSLEQLEGKPYKELSAETVAELMSEYDQQFSEDLS